MKSKEVKQTEFSLKKLDEALKDPDKWDAFVRKISEELEEERRRAVKCWCGNRCDIPYGDGKQCLHCASRPGPEIFNMMIY